MILNKFVEKRGLDVKRKVLSWLLTFSLILGLWPTAALAADDVAALTEKTVSVSNWADLKASVAALTDDEYLRADITAPLTADSELDIDGKVVVLSATAGDISITRTLQSEANSTNPIFKLTNNASLSISGTENGITLLDSTERKKSRGLIEADSGTTLNLSNVSFRDFKFGYTLAGSGYGAIYAVNATIAMQNVAMSNCIGDNGVLIYAKNSKVSMNECAVANTTYWGNSNSIGGVIQIEGTNSDVTMTNCKIEGCGSAEENGAANSVGPVWLRGGTIKISDSTFSKNMAMRGVGILAEDTNLTLKSVNITDNICRGDGYNPTTKEPDSNRGYVVWWQGAGLYIEDCTLSMSDVNITGNTGSFIGGGMYITGTNATMDDTINISNNSAVCGGGIYTDDDQHTITLNGTTIQNNAAVKKDAYSRYSSYNGCGAGIANDEGNVVLNGTDISGNIASAHGGGIINYGTATIHSGNVTGNKADAVDGCGGGICLAKGTVHVDGDTQITNNTANSGNGVYVSGGTTFEIQDKVVIDQNNDVALEGADAANNIPSAYITITAPFTGATKSNPINITSQDVSVEDQKSEPATDGTPLVIYTDDAGGENAALNADGSMLFVPSQYMQDGLLIGHSQKSGHQQWLTYVTERILPNVEVTYKNSSTSQEATDQLAYGTDIVVDPNEGALNWPDSVWDNSKNSEQQTLTVTKSITIPDATRDGYTFVGWQKTQENNVLTFTAQWKSNHNSSSGGSSGSSTKYTLHYESNGGTAYKDERYSSGTKVTLDKTPTRESYTFTGWYADKELTQKISSIKMTSDKTVYAGWKASTVPDMLNGDDHYAYVVGYSDGTVRPNANISRAEVATIFFRLLKKEVRDGNLTTENIFADVTNGQWHNKAISTMAKLGIVKGRRADSFDPDASITRAEFAAICARFNTKPVENSGSFSDISGHWAENEIERAAAFGWISGYPDGTFHPDARITRAEAMTMINRVLCRMPQSENDLLDSMVTWPDNKPSDWHYLAVQEATNSHDFNRQGEVGESWTKLTSVPDWRQYQ